MNLGPGPGADTSVPGICVLCTPAQTRWGDVRLDAEESPFYAHEFICRYDEPSVGRLRPQASECARPRHAAVPGFGEVARLNAPERVIGSRLSTGRGQAVKGGDKCLQGVTVDEFAQLSQTAFSRSRWIVAAQHVDDRSCQLPVFARRPVSHATRPAGRTALRASAVTDVVARTSRRLRPRDRTSGAFGRFSRT